MSKRFASDDSDKLPPAEGQEANRTVSDQSSDPQGSKLSRLYETGKIAERFVGRTEELAKLKRWFELALAGHGKPVFILGDPGIGKTELVRQFFAGLQEIDKICLNGRYFDVASGAPYKVFLDGLYDLASNLERTVFQDGSPFAVGDVKALQACLKEIRDISSATLMQETEGERIKYRTFELLAHSYRLLTPARPIILFLDDLQWADELSLEFLAYLIRSMQGERFFLICTVREHELMLENNPLRIWMRRMSRYNAYEQLKLHPLTEAETESLIGLIFAAHTFTENTIKLLHKETGGNPYYLLEIIKQLVEDQTIFPKDGGWECVGLDEVRLPRSLVDLTELQLGRLGDRALTIFEQAAVIGEEFSFMLLQSVTGLDEQELALAIEKGLREFLIREEPRSASGASENYTFYYNTIRKVLYEKLSTRQRRIIHMKAARTLEEATKSYSTECNEGDLAYHYFYAGEMPRAFYWSVEAASVACQRFTFDRAKKFFDCAERALQQLQEAGQPPEASLLAKHYYIYGQFRTALGEYEPAVELLRRAQAACRELGERQKEAEVLLSIANCLKLATSVTEALENYNAALGLARELNVPQLEWPAAHGAARCEAELGHPQLAIDLLQAGLAVLGKSVAGASEAEREQMASTRIEMEVLLAEVKEKLAKSQAEGHSAAYSTLEEQVCESSTPEKGSRVVEVMRPPTEVFKQYALWFKQLHSTNEILNKLLKSQLNPPRVVGLIFSGLRQLKGHIDQLDPALVNSQLSLIEKQLQEYQSWLQRANDMLPPYTMRQYLDQGFLLQEEMLQLARFMVMLQSESSDDKGKVELLLTRALELEVDRHQIIAGLFPLDMVFTPLPPEHPQLRLMESILAEIDGIVNYSDFITNNPTIRIKQAKAEFGQLFWHPQILTTVIEIDLKLDLQFKELLEKEQREIGAICDRLLREGIKMIPRRGQAGALDVEAARRMTDRAKELLKTNYESNRAGLMMLAEVGRFLRAHLQEQGLLVASDLPFNSPFVELDQAPTLPKAAPRALPPTPTVEISSASRSITSPPITPPPVTPPPAQRQEHSSSSHAIPKPFVGDSATPEAATTDGQTRGLIGEQIELKLQSRLAEICILLATKLRDVPVKVLQLKRSQLAMASWEVDALLSSEDDSSTPALNKQNYLIRRSIALLAEMQEVGISCRELLTTGQRSEAETALAMAESFLEQAKITAGELETQSHRERDAGQYSKAQNLAATRQKLMSTHQLLTTLIGWLKREMDK